MQSLLSVLAVAATASAGTVDVAYSNGWSKMEAVRASMPVSFTVAIKEQGAAEMVRIAKEVSDPDHKNYGKYLSAAQVTAIAKPAAADEKVRRRRRCRRRRRRSPRTHVVRLRQSRC